MKKTFFRSIKNPSRRPSRLATRPLTLETLEDRTLLATWGGFETTPDSGVYKNEAAAVIDFQLTPDLIKVCDVNGDGFDDIVTVNYAESKTLVYFQDSANPSTYGDAVVSPVSVGGENLLYDNSGGGVVAALGDFYNQDGVLDLLVVSQDVVGDTTLQLRLFAGDSDGGFTLMTTSGVSLNTSLGVSYSGYNGFFEMVPVGTGDAAVRFYGMAGINTSLDVTIRCNNNGSGSFDSRGTKLNVAAGENLLGSTTLDGKSFLATQDTSEGAFKFYNLGTGGGVSTIQYYASGNNYSVSSPDWSLVSGEYLYYAWIYNRVPSQSKLVAAKLSSTNGNVSAFGAGTYKVLVPNDVAFGNNTHAAVGCLNDDDFTDLICVTGTTYTFFKGESDTGLEYKQEATVVTNPSYLASYVNNGDLIVVGAYGIWSYKNCDLSSNPMQLASFSQPAIEAKFEFLGSQTEGVSDTRIDIAVLFNDTVGLFMQTADGAFASNSLSSGAVSVQFRGTVGVGTDAPMMAVGDFLGTGSAQIVVSYLDVNSVPYLAWIDPLDIQVRSDEIKIPNQTFAVDGGYAISSLAVGKFGSNEGVVYAVDKDAFGSTATGSKFFFLNKSGGSLATDPTEIALAGVEKPLCVSLADINGDEINDVVFLDAGTGALDAALYYLLGTATGFAAAPVLVESIDEAGDVGGLTLADLSGDGKLDAIFSLTKADGQSKTYVALGQTGGTLFEAPAYYYLLGDAFDGIDYLPESKSLNAAPSIFATAPVTENGFRNLYLVKGKTVVFLESAEKVDTQGNVRFVIGNYIEKNGVTSWVDYEWVDEWSSFYVSIWGTPAGSGASVKEFKTEFTFEENYFEYGGSFIAGGAGDRSFTVSVDASDSGKISVSGYSLDGVASDGPVLLARVKMTPVGLGGIGLSDLETPGVFQGFPNAESFGIAAADAEQSVNRSNGVSVTDTDSFDNLVVYPVRYDINDDGVINARDYTFFAAEFGRGASAAYPYYNPASAIFDVGGSVGVNAWDYTFFATGFGYSIGLVKASNARFYDLADQGGLVPQWWSPTPDALLPSEEGLAVNAAQSTAPSNGLNAPNALVRDALLIQLDGPESEFLVIDALDELAADQTAGESGVSGDEILPLLWNPEIDDETPTNRSDDAPESDASIATGLETALN